MDEHCLEIQKCSESRWLHHWVLVIAIGLLIGLHLAHWKRCETLMLGWVIYLQNCCLASQKFGCTETLPVEMIVPLQSVDGQ